MESWLLRHADQSADVVARGAALRTYRVGERDLVDGFGPDEVPPAFNGAVLAPWPNRIRDGRWMHDGTELQLAINEPSTGTALHGLLMWAPWQVRMHTAASVTLSATIAAQPAYPFELTVGAAYSLGPDGLRCELSARNDAPGGVDAVFGCGVHPFFAIAAAGGVDELTLQVPARTWVPTDAALLPTGREPMSTLGVDLLGGAALRDVRLDTAFTDVTPAADGTSAVRLCGAGQTTTIWADAAFGWWQVYTSDQYARTDDRYRRAVAIEPMTCGPDAFNTGADLIRLAPGQNWRASWGIRADAD